MKKKNAIYLSNATCAFSKLKFKNFSLKLNP